MWRRRGAGWVRFPHVPAKVGLYCCGSNLLNALSHSFAGVSKSLLAVLGILSGIGSGTYAQSLEFSFETARWSPLLKEFRVRFNRQPNGSTVWEARLTSPDPHYWTPDTLVISNTWFRSENFWFNHNTLGQVYPVQLRFEYLGILSNNPPEDFAVMIDNRSEADRNLAPRLDEIGVLMMPNPAGGFDGVASGFIGNANGMAAGARIEYLRNGTWVELALPYGGSPGSDGRFRGHFFGASYPPMIRVVLPGMPNNFGYAATLIQSAHPIPRESRPVRIQGGRSRFDIRTRTSSFGVRG